MSSSNVDLPQTNHAPGDASVAQCKMECTNEAKCSAIEWYDSAWSGTKCKLMLGDTPAAKGSSTGRWQDATCYIKPADDEPEKPAGAKILQTSLDCNLRIIYNNLYVTTRPFTSIFISRSMSRRLDSYWTKMLQ